MSQKFKILLAIGFIATSLNGASALADPIYVAISGADSNTGGVLDPIRNIQTALARASAGDEIIVGDGAYSEALQTQSGGTAAAPIVIRSQNPGGATITGVDDTLFDIRHSYVTVKSLIFDGQFDAHDVIRVRSTADHLTFDSNQVRNGAKDGLDLGNATSVVGPSFDYLENVQIVNSVVENFLGLDVSGNRKDAHGIVAGGVRNLLVSQTEISTVSGDGLQLADGNWDNVRVEASSFHNGPLTAEIAASSGYAVGVNPGEDGIDTKQDALSDNRGKLTIINSQFFGWDGDLITNGAALNLKEKVDVTIDGSLFSGNEIGLRLRGDGGGENGALILALNNVFLDSEKAIRIEDDIDGLQLLNNTFGVDLDTALQFVDGGAGDDFLAQNNLFLAALVPSGISDVDNLAVDSDNFVDAANGDYQLVLGSDAIDTAILLSLVQTDALGVLRPIGDGADFGAFEFVGPVPVPLPAGFWLLMGPLALLVRNSRRFHRRA